MGKKKIFLIGFIIGIGIVLTVQGLIEARYRSFSYDVWSYYPDAQALEDKILKDYPIGTPVSHLMRNLRFSELEFMGDPSEGSGFEMKADDSCCAFYYHTSRGLFWQGRYQGVKLEIEFDIGQNITAVKVFIGEGALEYAP